MGDAQTILNAAGRPPTVLVVEDEALVRLVICDALRMLGFTVVEAANAEEAEAVIAAGLPVDLVFTDVRMPGAFDGLELARRLKAARPELPILVTSAHLDATMADWVAGFLPKPYLPADALALIFGLVGRSAYDV